MPDEEESGELSDEELDLFGFISSSERRSAVVSELLESPQTPKNLAENTDIRINHVSNVLAELESEKIVTCVNPDRQRGRVYKLTPVGKKVASRHFSNE